ncbi:MAG: hypothetical protein U0930_01395 [Pirellulales bacterium]
MNRLVNLALVAICCFAGHSPSVRADDCEEKLKNEALWVALEPEQSEVDRLELKSVLKILLCEIDKRPALDPAKALEKATKQLHASMKDLISSVESQTDPELVGKLSALLPEAKVNPSHLDEPYSLLKKVLHHQSGNSTKLMVYARLARAIESYKLVATGGYSTPADYSKLVKEDFKKALFAYVSARRGTKEQNDLGQKVALLEAFADADKSSNIDDLLIAVRKVCKRPNFWLLVSDKLINDLLNSAVNPISDAQCVSECILDTSIRGTAQVTANATVSTNESLDYAALKVSLNGSSTSDTVGYHKPVQIKSLGSTTFSAEKNLCISDAAFNAGRAAASACTDTTICSIDKVGRQCLSNLIERVAWKRACQQKPQAEAIASQKFECKLEASFDGRLDSALVKVRTFYEDRVKTPLSRLGILPGNPKFSSTISSVAVGATLAKREVLGAPNYRRGQAAGQTQNDLTLTFHDSILIRNASNEVPPEVIDRLINEFLSNIRGVDKGAQASDHDPKIFGSVFDVVKNQAFEDLSGNKLEEALKGNLPKNGKLEFSGLTYEDGWISLNWRLKQ